MTLVVVLLHPISQLDTDGNGTLDLRMPPTGDVGPGGSQDVVPPSISIDPEGTKDADGWYVGAVKVTITATDTQSGVAKVSYSTDSGQTVKVYSGPFTVSAEQVSVVVGKATDRTGNEGWATARLRPVKAFLPTALRHQGAAPPAAQWHVGTGIQARAVYGLAVDPANCNTLYAATDRGLYKSTDGGNSWRSSGLNSVLAAQAPGVAAPPFAKADGGSASSTLVSAVTIDPNNSQVIYATTWGQGVYKSTNGGASWAQINNGLGCLWLYGLTTDPANSQILYTGGHEHPAGQGGGVYKSTNGGTSWFPVVSGLSNRNVHALAVDPRNRNVVYTGTQGGIFKSTNGGNQWQFASQPGNGYPWAIAIDPGNGQTVYAGLGGGGVYKSTNGGANWSPANGNLAHRDLRALVIDAANSQTLYAGTNGGGVYATTNGGKDWNPVNRGLGNLNVKALRHPANCGIMHAGTAQGAWWYGP